jgi:hypothetical protein
MNDSDIFFSRRRFLRIAVLAGASLSFLDGSLRALVISPNGKSMQDLGMVSPQSPALITSQSSWNKFREEILSNPEDMRSLAKAAQAARDGGRLSVVDKKRLPPSGDPHDYSSQAPYWWPDPAKPDGVPYIRRDGRVNPEFYGSDRQVLEAFRERFSCLILHAWATGDEESSRAAGRLLRVWFIDPATKMNPHLRYAQRIPGVSEGRGIGIIDTSFFCYLLDEVGRLRFSEDWTPDDLVALKAWFSAYLDWLLESPNGKDEGREINNHGTWYDAQVACFAVFCGRDEIAIRQIEGVSRDRMETQFEEDGKQPHELVRTLSLNYCTFNLIAFTLLAQLGRKVSVDLWDWQPKKGGTLRQAIQWMLPYYLNERPWTWPQVGEFNPEAATYLLGLAAEGADDKIFAGAAEKLTQHRWEKVSFWTASIRKE